MKRFLIILFSISLLTSCNINIYTGESGNDGKDSPTIDKEPTTPLFQREDLYGTWKVTKAKFAEDATMTEWEYEDTYATFKENGLYEGKGHWGDGEGFYSITQNTITTFVANTPYITYEVTSLNETEAEIKATLIETSQKIWITCEKVEIIDTAPDSDISTETAVTFENTKVAVAGAYAYLRDYMLYHHYIEYNALSNNRIPLKPESEMISNAWERGYQVVHQTNQALNSLSAYTNFDWAKECILHFKIIRAFAYYNMVTLWGDIPYWTENDNPMDIMRLSRTKAEDVINAEISSLSNIAFNTDILDFGNSAFSTESAKLLLTEMYLYVKNQQQAQALLSGIGKGDNQSKVIFAISLDNYTPVDDNYFNSYKDKIGIESNSTLSVYTTTSIELYTAEANGRLTDLPNLWNSNREAQYGYWPMLNRIGKASEIIGCSKEEALMPLPEMETLTAPDLAQNPGY